MARSHRRQTDAMPASFSYRFKPDGTRTPSHVTGEHLVCPDIRPGSRSGLPSGAIWHTEPWFSKALERGYWACVLLKLVFVVNQTKRGRGYVKTCPRCGHPPFLAPLHRVHTCPVCTHPRTMVDTIRGLCDCVGASPDLVKAIGSPQFEDVFSIINELTSHLTNKESL